MKRRMNLNGAHGFEHDEEAICAEFGCIPVVKEPAPRPDLSKLHALSEQMYAKSNVAGTFSRETRVWREAASMVLALETELLAVPQTQEPKP